MISSCSEYRDRCWGRCQIVCGATELHIWLNMLHSVLTHLTLVVPHSGQLFSPSLLSHGHCQTSLLLLMSLMLDVWSAYGLSLPRQPSHVRFLQICHKLVIFLQQHPIWVVAEPISHLLLKICIKESGMLRKPHFLWYPTNSCCQYRVQPKVHLSVRYRSSLCYHDDNMCTLTLNSLE